MYRCTNDRYCQDTETFEDIYEFQEMCQQVFGEVCREVQRSSDGNYYDDADVLVLELVAE